MTYQDMTRDPEIDSKYAAKLKDLGLECTVFGCFQGQFQVKTRNLVIECDSKGIWAVSGEGSMTSKGLKRFMRKYGIKFWKPEDS